jgi:hypothetical protein
VDLDIPPKTILFDEDIYNPTGIEAYMAGLYRRLPMDDYNVSGNNNGDRQGYFGSWEAFRWPMISTGETVNRHEKGLYLHCAGYWREGWKLIRDANRLIDNLPNYIGKIEGAENWIAEAKFIRAYVYFTMTKRYGGLPVLEHVQDFDPEFENLNVARSSCKDTYDFILLDLKDAEERMSKTKLKGRANAYVATALKSKVALFAASIAKYGKNYIYTDNNVMLCGIPENQANDYYKIAWEASRALEGQYSLVGDGETDPVAQEKNFENVFTNANESPESIFIRKYDLNFFTHSFDLVYRPARLVTDGGDRYGVTLDWMELFDGPYFNDEENSGRLDLVYKNNGGYYYKVFDYPGQLYEGAEPRLRASILVPGNTYNGAYIDMRRGVLKDNIDPATPIAKLSLDDYVTQNGYDNPIQPGMSYFQANIVQQTSSNRPGQQKEEDMYEATLPSGEKVKIYKNGLDGPGARSDRAALTGIQGRKWLDLTLPTAAVAVYASSQSWIDIRYAEVVLNRAEAALELYQNGVTSVIYDGTTYNTRTDAFNNINKIRQRAGANLLLSENELSTDPAYNRPGSAIAAGIPENPGKGGFVFAPNRGIQIIRVERYKELAFEHKLYWDLRRWFSFHIQINKYKRRMLNPFIFAKTASTFFDGIGKEVPTGKYIYDVRVCEQATNELNFPINGTGVQTYYEYIPTAEMKKNPLLHGNRGQ